MTLKYISELTLCFQLFKGSLVGKWGEWGGISPTNILNNPRTNMHACMHVYMTQIKNTWQRGTLITFLSVGV